MEPTFFASPAEFRAWLERHHATERELLVGFHRKASGCPSMTWAESVDEALCFGWVDGVRRSIDGDSYSIRLGLMTPAGREAFARRTDDRSAVYSHEQRKHPEFEPEQQQRFSVPPEPRVGDRAGARGPGAVRAIIAAWRCGSSPGAPATSSCWSG
jgi:hypothetical protein